MSPLFEVPKTDIGGGHYYHWLLGNFILMLYENFQVVILLPSSSGSKAESGTLSSKEWTVELIFVLSVVEVNVFSSPISPKFRIAESDGLVILKF